MEKLLQNRVVFVSGEMTMHEVIRTMRDHNISSVLVTDQDDIVAGIITERDIVQKFTLLEVKDKLQAKAFAVMTRPIFMARVSQLYEDIRDMFRTQGYRHFPVTTLDHHKKHVIGIMTVTDIASAWLLSHSKAEPKPQKPPLTILAGDEDLTKSYESLFAALGMEPDIEGHALNRLEKAVSSHIPILMDIDHVGIDMAKEYLSKVKHHGSVLILLSSDPKLVAPLQKHLHGPLMSVSLKPLDISQILRVLRQVNAYVADRSA
jgi:CBS domain-containing protein